MNDANWDNVRKLFRQACFLRGSGDEAGAVQILGKEMPGAVSAWSAKSRVPDDERKKRLQEMFQEEMQKVEEALELCDHMMARFEASFAQQIGTILYDLQILLYSGFGLDTSNIRMPEAQPARPLPTAPRPATAKPAPEPAKPTAKQPAKEKGKVPEPEPEILETPAIPPKIPRLDPEALAEKLATFTKARKEANKDWQSILFNDVEKIIDTVLNEAPKSGSYRPKS